MVWEKVTLGEVCHIEKGNIGILKATQGDYPLVVLGEERRTHNEYQFDGDAVVIPLVSSTGHGDRSMKRIHFQSGKFSVGSILCAVMPKDSSALSAEFLYRYLDLNKEKELVSRMKGMANVSLSIKSIAEVEIPIPPIEKQQEIITKFYAIETSNNILLSEHNHQLNFLKKLRHQILQDAMQGKLVLQDPNDEPASKLLERIKIEKERLFREKKIKKEKPLPEIKPEEIPFELPEKWMWCRMGKICTKITDGTHHSPTNTETGAFKYVTAKNIKDSGIELSNITYISKVIHNQIYARCNPEKEDILYIKDGATTGIVTINNLSEEFSMLSSVALLKLPKVVSNKFLMYSMRSPYFYEATRNDMFGVAITRVTLEKIQNSILALPPLPEQIRIVTKIEQFMKLCDELEQSIQQNQIFTQELLQVALKEALS